MVNRSYWLGSGELSRGIMTDPFFRDAVVQVLAQAPTPSPTPTPSTTTKTCSRLEEEPPCGPGVEIGKLYPYTVYTRCEVLGAYFDARRWIADPILGVEGINPIPDWQDPYNLGSMELVDENKARFISSGGLVTELRALPAEAKDTWRSCY